MLKYNATQMVTKISKAIGVASEILSYQREAIILKAPGISPPT